MGKRKLLVISLGLGAAVALLPALFPTGPTSGLDAATYLQGGRLAAGALIVFIGGLLTSLTPCVYPLIPITVSVFGARKDSGRGKSLLLTSAFIIGMGVVFSALGVAAARTGAAFGQVLGSRWVVLGLAAVLLALAASMFGAFELALPSSLNQKLSRVGGAGVVGAFLMGSVAGFLAAPCTGPVLAGLLAYVAKTQSTALGAGLLFVYALGVGVPFFLIGVFALRLPKSGVWMEWVKSLLGLILVALAAMYVKDAFPAFGKAVAAAAGQLGQWPGAWIAAAIVILGLLAGAVHRSFGEGGTQATLKAAGVVLVVGGLVLRGGAMNASPVGALWVRAGWAKASKPAVVAWTLRFDGSEGLAPFDRTLKLASEQHRPVMIDFFADWCAACKELDRKTYIAPSVARASNRFVNIKVDATHDPDAIEKLFARFGIQGLPTVAFISSKGQVLDAPRITGFLPPSQFLGALKKVN